jgi:hydroxyacylglutathione hydrolase
MYEIHTIDTAALGDRSYLVHDEEVAFVIDPQRDIDRVVELAAACGVRITHVFETHVHNDYVTGGFALANATGAAYHLNEADPVAFRHDALRDGEVVAVSRTLRVKAVSTPGHTYTHLSYVLEVGERPVAVFTGGSLLYGSTGRPDLLGDEHTKILAHHQHGSARRLATSLPEDAAVLPTHGFGSFCSATQAEGESSTIGHEKVTNPALLLEEDEYVSLLLEGLDAYPAYYAHMAPANLLGPSAPDLEPPSLVDPATLRRRLEAGEWVVDLRDRSAFARGHLVGSLNFSLDTLFTTYLGWLIPWGMPLTLLGETAEQIAEARRALVRIGIDQLAGAATGAPSQWSGGATLGSFPIASFEELKAAKGADRVVLDVRRDLEWREVHLEGAVHIPLHELVGRLDELPGGEVWVHCAAGYRSGIAASILARAKRRVVAIDDELDNAAKAGLSMVEGSLGA